MKGKKERLGRFAQEHEAALAFDARARELGRPEDRCNFPLPPPPVPGLLTSLSSQGVVGRRAEILWEEDPAEWFAATIIAFDAPSGCVLVLFDDDDGSSWLVLAGSSSVQSGDDVRYQFLDPAAPAAPEEPVEEPVADEEPVVDEEPVADEPVVVDPMDALQASEAVVACLQAEVARQDLINDAQGALLRATRLLARDDEL